MSLDQDACYRAFRSRDRRFEGRFVVAVKSTKIYCRPGCPARLPRRDNVLFLPCGAAAEEAGFRPCMRCRPDTSPDSAAWLGTSAIVARALRLIDEGALEEEGVEDLSSRLGMGARHLRRLFVDLIGAPPRAIARTRRAHFARALLEETNLPLRSVAAAAGFRSSRRFSSVIRETFGRPPRDLRRGGSRGRAAPEAGEGLRLRLPYRPPFDWESLIGFLAPRSIPGVEEVEGDCYRRTVRLDGGAGTIAVKPALGESALDLWVRAPAGPRLDRLARRVRRLFDLDADPDRIARDLGRDPLLAPLLGKRPGLRIPGAWDGFETAVRAILGQQIAVGAATTLAGRLAARFGTAFQAGISWNGCGARREAGGCGEGLTRLFPVPEVLAAVDLSLVGIPRGRAEAIRGLAAAVLAGDVLLDGSIGMEEAVERLRALPGIGEWTARYVAMRVLGEPDAMPYGDLGLRRALGLTEAALRKRSETWRPWRAYAAIHIWRAGSLARAARACRRRARRGKQRIRRRKEQG